MGREEIAALVGVTEASSTQFPGAVRFGVGRAWSGGYQYLVEYCEGFTAYEFVVVGGV